MSDLLYLDTARLGRVSPGAAAALRDFVAMASDEGGGLYFDRFLFHGVESCPDTFASRYPGLASWRGVSALKSSLRAVAQLDPSWPVLLASRSTALMRFAARFLFHPCRNVLTTDLDWQPYSAILAEEAERAGRVITQVQVRDDALAGRLSADELVELLCRRYAADLCDGLYLTAVSNLGVRTPVEELVTRLEASSTVRSVVVDGAQDFSQVDPTSAARHGDLYIAGCHKWLGGYHPLGVAFYGRERSRGRVETILDSAISRGDLDDPLLRFTSHLEAGTRGPLSETVNLASLFAASGAAVDRIRSGSRFRTRLENLDVAAEVVSESGWTPLLPNPELRSGILLAKTRSSKHCGRDPEALRGGLREHGVAATSYGGGLVRFSMPADSWRTEELDRFRKALARVHDSRSPTAC